MIKILRTAAVTALMLIMCTCVVSADPSVDELKDEKKEAEEDLQDLEDQLDEVVASIDQLEQDLVAKGEEIIEAEDDLKEAEAEEQEQYDDMCLRIQYIYESGSEGYLSAILEADSFTDMLNRIEYTLTMEEYDQDKLQEYTDTVNKVKKLKKKLEEEQKELEDLEAEYEDKQDELDKMIEDKKDDIEDLEKKIEEAVRKAEEEARKAREEEEARAAAAAAAASSSSGAKVAESTYGNGTDEYQCDNDDEKAQTIVYAAYSQLGVPYVWGGSSPGKALDCSGLVQYCLKQAGISVPHYSGDIGSGGTKVSSPKAGDVVCYSGHCAIYVGGGKMIEAPHSGAVVKVSSVRSGCWYRRYW